MSFYAIVFLHLVSRLQCILTLTHSIASCLFFSDIFPFHGNDYISYGGKQFA